MHLTERLKERSMMVLSASTMGTAEGLGIGKSEVSEFVGEKASLGMTGSNGLPHVSASEVRLDQREKECGICSTAVVNRGVLDCCNDWFCFACIDDWATVTNLCPLCKARFRFITCLPVRQGDGREGDLSAGFAKRVDGPDEDEGRHPFSFPSYFIDEEAVLCLEGDACRVRAGLISQNDDGEIAADTSVACDLCDCWYHAGCVDFDPDQPAFYCPRCRNPQLESHGSLEISSPWPSGPSEAKQPLLEILPASKSEIYGNGSYQKSPSVEWGDSAASMPHIPVHRNFPTTPAKDSGPIWSPIREPVKPSYNHGSMRSPIGESLDSLRNDEQWSPTPGSAIEGNESEEELLWSPTPETERLSWTTCKEQASASLLLPATGSNSGAASVEGDKRALSRSVSFAAVQRPDISKGHAISNLPKEMGSLASPSNQPFKRTPSFNIAGVSDRKEIGIDVEHHQPASEQTNRRKKRDFPENGMTDFKNLPEPPQKVARTSVKNIDSSEKKQSVGGKARAPLNTSPNTRVSAIINDQKNAEKSLNSSEKDVETSVEEVGAEEPGQDQEPGTGKQKSPASRTEVDVMEIVSGPQSSLLKERIEGSEKQEGVRTRIIMHREQSATDAAGSSFVGRIRSQMKEGADYTKGDVVEVSDDKFIAAFMAAVARSRKKDVESTEAASRPGISSNALKTRVVDAKRSRASLTRKLYAGGTGRWDRDWDIAFWKERSARRTTSKKETGDEKNSLQVSRAQSKKADPLQEDSLFTRLFVADNSLFPRKEELQPILVPGETSAASPLSDVKGKRASHSPLATASKIATNGINTVNITRSTGPNSKRETPLGAERNLVPSGEEEKSSLKASAKYGLPPPQASKTFKGGETASPVTDVRRDKRQWALDVLARKTGTLGNGSQSAVRPRDATSASGQLNLMAQLPDDMRPLFPHDRRSKVPTAVRQVQLNRLIEQELKRANLETVQRSNETEEAVHKAQAREEEIYEKANSKGVYINLCVRALSQAEAEGQSNQASALDVLVHTTLQATGLIDTPPGSPEDAHTITSINSRGEAIAEEIAEKLTESHAETPLEESQAINLISSPSLLRGHDINIEDEENAAAVSRIQAIQPGEGADGDGKKLNFVLSTFSSKDSAKLESLNFSMPAVDRLGSDANEGPSSSQVCNESEKKLEGQHPVICSTAEPPFNINYEAAPLSSCELHLEQNPLSSNTRQEQNALETVTDNGTKRTSMETVCASAGEVESFLRSKIEKAPNSPTRTEETSMDDWMDSGKFADLDRRIEDIRRKTSPSAAKDLEVPWSSSRADGIPGDEDLFNIHYSVQKQVEVFVNQHLKPLYKSGVIKADQFRYTVSKTAAKVMEYHENAVSADFLIAEGAKVRKLADQYLQAYSKRKSK